MTTFKVQGGYKLKGDLHPQGAKNEALQVLCAVLLTPSNHAKCSQHQRCKHPNRSFN